MILGERAEAMARRLRRTALGMGIDQPGVEELDAAFRLAMERRLDLDDHHPDHLHPARTALILMDDVGVAEALTLAAATSVDTRTPDLAPAVESLRRFSPAVAKLAEAIPVPDPADPTLVERLVVAETRVRLIALAEQLDHTRHLHLRPRGEWRAAYDLVERVYAPLADRTDPTLARRYRTWCGAFARRFPPTT